MSDIVPPEVRPKPAVPAKPPNVGAASPSNPFPTPGPGIGAPGGAAPLPPSGIPVPIGSHGPAHMSSHGAGHAIGHGGSHAAAHNGGHGGSHSAAVGSALLGYIGIDTIIEQMRKKTMKTGFDFNIMVVGEWRERMTRWAPSAAALLLARRCPFVSRRRSQRPGEVHPGEHALQVAGEQEERRLEPR